MPKKFKGENTKAVEAKARKESAKQAEAAKKQKEVDDAYWKDDDKHVNAKQQRKEEKERKQREAAQKKQELAELYTEEMTKSAPKARPTGPVKLTRLQIETTRQEDAKAVAATKEKEVVIPVNDLPLEENLNRLEIENEARSVEEAISMLSSKPPEVNMHPEKLVKAAYKAWEEENMPKLKADFPNMRLAQLKHMLHKNWNKSPANPMNHARGSS